MTLKEIMERCFENDCVRPGWDSSWEEWWAAEGKALHDQFVISTAKALENFDLIVTRSRENAGVFSAAEMEALGDDAVIVHEFFGSLADPPFLPPEGE